MRSRFVRMGHILLALLPPMLLAVLAGSVPVSDPAVPVLQGNTTVTGTSNTNSSDICVDISEATGYTSPTVSPIPSGDTSWQGTADSVQPVGIASARAALTAYCRSHAVTGLSAAVFRGEDILFSYDYGYADKEQRILVRPNTKYRIASISKLVTGMMVMGLADEGRLSLDADISRYIGLHIRSPYYPDVPITVRELMQHTSSIVDSRAYAASSNSPPYRTLAELVSAGGMHSKAKPGTRYQYSNFGAGLLAGVIEGVTGERFYTYAKRAWLEPLGIDGGYLHTQVAAHDAVANIYSNGRLRYELKQSPRREGGYDNIPLGQLYLLAHGDLIVSAEDLAVFAVILSGDGTYRGKRWLNTASVEQMNTGTIAAGNNNRSGLNQIVTASLYPGRTMHGHSGSAYGMIAGLWYDRTDRTGFTFLTNGAPKDTAANGHYGLAVLLARELYETILPAL